MENLKGKLSSLKSSISNHMRDNPAKWAGIATGAGFALGLTGRLMRSRMRSRRAMPDLIIIEGAC